MKYISLALLTLLLSSCVSGTSDRIENKDPVIINGSSAPVSTNSAAEL